MRFNFDILVSLRTDLDEIAKKSGRSGAADILRQIASEYVQWWRHGRTPGRRPAWTKERRKRQEDSPT